MTKKPIVFPETETSGEPTAFLEESWPTMYADLKKEREEGWTRLAERYEANPGSVYEAWHWLNNHPIFYYYTREDRRHEKTLCDDRGVCEGLELMPMMVDKVTRKVVEPAETGELEIWVEVFPASLSRGNGDIRLHDHKVDTGASTYEEALVKVAALIYERHGHDRVRLDGLWDGA